VLKIDAALKPSPKGEGWMRENIKSILNGDISFNFELI